VPVALVALSAGVTRLPLLATAAFEPGLLSQAFLWYSSCAFLRMRPVPPLCLMWSNTSSACPGRDGSGWTACRSAPDLLPQLSSARQQRFMWTYRQTYRQDSQLGVPTEA